MVAAADDHAPDQAEHHDAEQHAHETNIEPHVAIQYVAELVRDHALQFIAVQQLQRAAGYGNRGIGRVRSRPRRH